MPREPIGLPKKDLRPDPSRFAETKGREIEGLPVKEERFTKLEPGRDYNFTDINPQVQNIGEIGRFMLFVNPTKGTETRKVKPPHWRTISTEDVGIIKVDARSHAAPRTGYFYEVNTKGAGFLKPTAEGISVDDYDNLLAERGPGDYKVLGFVRTELLMQPKNIVQESMWFFEKGLRAEVYWAVADLQAVPFKGEMTSVQELRNREVIPADGKGYSQALRVLKDNDRVAEAAEASNRRGEVFAKAFSVFNREARDAGLEFPELDIANSEHQKIYFQEFFRRMGSNLGILIENGIFHYHLHSANITMAAEVVDIESCQNWRLFKLAAQSELYKDYDGVKKYHIKDMRDMASSLKKLLHGADKAGMDYGNRRELVQICLSGFDGAVNARTLNQRQESDPRRTRAWLEAILTKVIVDGVRLPAINNPDSTDSSGNRYTIENWGIDIDNI